MVISSLFLAVLIAFDRVPDSPSFERQTAAEAADLSISCGFKQPLFQVSLPRGWSMVDLNMKRPLGRYRDFADRLVRMIPEARPGIVVMAGGGETNLCQGPIIEGLVALGRKLAAARPSFVMFDGIFDGMSNPEAVKSARLLRQGLQAVPAGFRAGPEQICFAESIAGALAAEGQIPIVCLDNSVPCELSLKDIPSRVIATQAKIRGNVIWLEDADTIPRNLWMRSSTGMLAGLTTSIFSGAKGAVFGNLTSPEMDGYPPNPAYASKLAEYRGFLNVLVDQAAAGTPAGVAIPIAGTGPAPESADWAGRYFGAVGIPFYAANSFPTGQVVALMGKDSVERLTDRELGQILAARVLVDGDAAVALTLKGLSKYSGVEAMMPTNPLPFNCERRNDGVFVTLSGSNVPLLKPLEGSAVISTLVHRHGTFDQYDNIAPAAVYFRNEAGGEIAVTVFNGRLERGNFWNESRRDFMVELLEQLNHGPLPFRVRADQDVLCLVRGDMQLVVNTGLDPLDIELPWTFAQSPRTDFECLGRNGVWAPYKPAPLPAGGFLVLRTVR